MGCQRCFPVIVSLAAGRRIERGIRAADDVARTPKRTKDDAFGRSRRKIVAVRAPGRLASGRAFQKKPRGSVKAHLTREREKNAPIALRDDVTRRTSGVVGARAGYARACRRAATGGIEARFTLAWTGTLMA